MDENKNEEQTNIIEEEIDDNIIIEKINYSCKYLY